MEINPFSDVCLGIQVELCDYGRFWFFATVPYWTLIWFENELYNIQHENVRHLTR